jgi:hypothetical protein
MNQFSKGLFTDGKKQPQNSIGRVCSRVYLPLHFMPQFGKIKGKMPDF